MRRFDPKTLNYSGAGIALTKMFEQLRLTAYLPTKGDVPTIGWGHTRGVKMGDVCTVEQAEQYLWDDLTVAIIDVQKNVTIQLSQHEFDALVDFAFNCGTDALNHSTLLRLLNSGDYLGASHEFAKWNHASGKVLAGLTRRRAEETEIFCDES